MKLNKTIGRVATTLVATAMLASLAAPAYAADTEPIEQVDFKKYVTTDGNTFAPATDFEFDIQSAGAGTTTVSNTPITYKAGVDGVLSVEDITSQPNTSEETKERYEFTGSIKVDASKLEGQEPGVYHYQLSEKDTGYEGMDYSSAVYDIYVYYLKNEAMNDQYVKSVVVALNGTKVSDNSFAFTNNYGDGDTEPGEDPEVPGDDGKIHDVIVTKNVEGKLASANDSFSFEVSVTGASGEAYKVVYTNSGVPTTTFVESGKTITPSGLKDGDTIHIYGLSESDTYTVTEQNVETNGYVVTDTVGEDDGVVTGNVTKDGQAETITNTKDTTPPTGIVMDIAPYALLVVVAAAGCFVFLRKRRED